MSQEAQQTPSKMNSKRPTETHYNQIDKREKNQDDKSIDKDQIFRAVRQMNHRIQGIINTNYANSYLQISHQKIWRPEDSRQTKCSKKKTVNQELEMWQNCPSRVREKSRHSQINNS